MGLLPLLGQWASQGVVTFAVGLLPFFTTSHSLLVSLTAFGTGRLIGSSLFSLLGSVFIGALSASVPEVSALGFSPVAGAIIHVVGILFMLIAERRLSSRTLNTGLPGGLDSDAPPSPLVAAQNDTELREKEQTGSLAAQTRPFPSRTARLETLGPHHRRVYLFIFAFVVEEIASGIGFGYAATAPPWKPDDTSDNPSVPRPLSMLTLHLLALVGDVATTLGFATTLLSSSLPVAECKQHVLLYTAARPLAGLLSYSVTTLSGIVPSDDRPFMLVLNSFTGGLFVYAALVVRTLIVGSRTARSGPGLVARVSLMAAGALLSDIVPMLVSVGLVWYAGKLTSHDTVEVT
ncbi:hypothetical protein V8D89_004046 [Ganoderma adspersum]